MNEVHDAGGWKEEVGNLKKCKALFLKDPARQHACCSQTDMCLEKMLQTEQSCVYRWLVSGGKSKPKNW